jgi:hypothetical protein
MVEFTRSWRNIHLSYVKVYEEISETIWTFIGIHMKIVKQFDDYDFFKSRFYMTFDKNDPKYINGIWRWGLGDDGELYCQCSDFENPEDWYNLYSSMSTSFRPNSIRQMKKIVKEFGHLLVFT